MANLPGYKYQSRFNDLRMKNWYPIPSAADGRSAGKYKCLGGEEEGLGQGRLCYVEIDGAGHVLSLDKPKEGSLMISKWMTDLDL
jgi:hypothetical protein